MESYFVRFSLIGTLEYCFDRGIHCCLLLLLLQSRYQMFALRAGHCSGKGVKQSLAYHLGKKAEIAIAFGTGNMSDPDDMQVRSRPSSEVVDVFGQHLMPWVEDSIVCRDSRISQST